MRIYEFAQQHNISSKDIIKKLQQSGFDVKSHMSILDEDALAVLKKEFSAHSKKEASQESSSNSQPAKPIEKPVSEPLSTSESLKKSIYSAPKKATESKQPQKKQEPVQKKQEPVQKKQEEAAAQATAEPLVLRQMSLGEFSDKVKSLSQK